LVLVDRGHVLLRNRSAYSCAEGSGPTSAGILRAIVLAKHDSLSGNGCTLLSQKLLEYQIPSEVVPRRSLRRSGKNRWPDIYKSHCSSQGRDTDSRCTYGGIARPAHIRRSSPLSPRAFEAMAMNYRRWY